MKTTTLKRITLGVAVAAALGSGYGLGVHGVRGISFAHAEQTAPVATAAAAPAPVAPAAAQTLPDFRHIVERLGPAVVNISTEGTVKTGMRGTPFGNLDPQDPFFQFFRQFGPQFQAPPAEQVVRGLGSGFIISKDGLILTNAHVVADAQEVTVKLTDKREFKAKVLGMDKPTDVAVLKIDAGNLPTVALGNPADAQVGDWVLAIGAPFGFENSVTAGIISAKSRSLPDEGYVPFIQTDVAVNPGNSGGPLLNLKGEVIGINSQIYTRSGGYQGLSFAIPIDVAARVENQIVEHGTVTRGRIGVAVQDLNQALAESFGLDKPAGALVSSVEEGGPAARAGLEAGDVIVALDGQPVADSADLPPKIAAMAPGSKARLSVWRKGERRDIDITVVAAAKDGKAAVAERGNADQAKLGLAVRPLQPAEREQAGIDGGVLVVDVAGPAAKAGIQSGDLILAVNGTPVSGIDQLRGLIGKAKKHVALLIQRNDAKLFVPVELG